MVRPHELTDETWARIVPLLPPDPRRGQRRPETFAHLLGRNGFRAGSKVVSLMLAASAVKLIREGLVAIWPVSQIPAKTR